MNGDVLRIVIAGASGTIGSQLVPQLAAGRPVAIGTIRSAAEDGMASLRHLENGVTS